MPLTDWLGLWLPIFKNAAPPTVHIWITQMDGSKPYLLGVQEGQQRWGFMELPGSDGLIRHELIDNIKWSPDGNRLGYLYKDAYYAVPIPLRK